ncbi:hypothetical protein U9M48_024641 [Paspalum notatum var. saurae]|uniref:Integrase catalytic domain-containing protein n=1 Tax=Paspalum notatum var. saurae TaxID=547442 RepID=A0AAQ3TMQ0_PASNO
MLEQNSRELKAQNKMLEKAAKKLRKLKAQLPKALEENERLRSVRPQPSEIECPTCESFMTELGDKRDRYAKPIEEIDELKVELGKLQSKLDEPTLSGELECESCPCLAKELAVLKEKFEGQFMELEELRARPTLLGACIVCPTLRGELEQLRADFEVLSAPTDTCENCLTLRMQLVDRDATIRKLEKAAMVPSLDYDTCATQTVVLEDLREEVLSLQNDNNRLREVLIWAYARQPQLEMIIGSTKRAEGETSGVGFGECNTSGEKSAPVKVKTTPTQPGETVDGVYHEPPKAAPMKQYWTPKPSKAKLDKIVEEELTPKGKTPVQQPEPPKVTPPKPKSQPNPVPRRPVYHCEFCQRNGHLEEFCFRRKRVERQERAWGNQDQFYQGGRQDPSHRGERRDRFAGSERGSGLQARAPSGERRFTGRAPSHFQHGYGPRDRGFERAFEGSRFGGRGYPDRRDDFFDCAYPTFEQMARHWHMTGHHKWFSSLIPVSTKEYITFGDNGQGFEVHFKKGACCVLDAEETFVCSLLPFGQDEAFGFVWDLVLRLRNESHKAMRAIRSDNGGEFRKSRFENFCRDLGLEHQFSSPYTPPQNGVVERKNRTLIEMARTMLDENRTPRGFWAEAVNTACYIANRIFLRAFLGKTSYELRFGRQPSVKHLRAFGCRCFVLKKAGHLDKFESCCLDGIFLGYASSSRAFRVWILEAKQVVKTCEVSFDETMPCTTLAFELSGDDEEGTPIFEDEKGAVDVGDAGATAPAAAPAPSATSSDDEGGPLPMASSSLPRQQAHVEAAPVEYVGEVTSEIVPSRQQMDVKSAFLNVFIEEEVYVRQPPGFESTKFPDRVYKLRKAPKACFAEQMSSEFEMSLMGELQFFLVLQIRQGPEGTFVHQAKYTRDILKKFNMGDSKPMTTPMSTNTALDADKDGEAVD